MDLHHVVGSHRLLLNGEWEFALGPDGTIPATGWRTVRVPHRSREFEDNPPTSGWYRTKLQVPPQWPCETGRLILDLGRVRHFGRAYIDGQPVGEHFHLRIPWHLDLSSHVGQGGRSELAVFTHNCSGAYAYPCQEGLSEAAEAALDTRFWHTSAATIGMEGDVWLGLEPTARLLDPYVVTSVRNRSIQVEITIANDGDEPFRGLIDWQACRRGSVELQLPTRPALVEAGERQTVAVSLRWTDPLLWGRPPYGEPVLYYLQAALVRSDGKALHETSVPFGFREIWAEGDLLLLNGKQLMPWGDHTTPYVFERQWLTRKFQDLADANVSIVEHHRYDPPPVYYDVADELGIFVVAANFCIGTGQVPSGLEEREQQLVVESHLAVTDCWLRRSRNHPSILFWDITDAPDPAFCNPLLRKVAQLDPSRVAEVAFDPELADAETVSLIGCYRLFNGLEQIESAIAEIGSNPRLPQKPMRVGEAGIFENADCDPDTPLPLMQGWWEFLLNMPERNIHGLQTFFLADMDYRGLGNEIPGALSVPLSPAVTWPSQSGMDARIDPFGEGTQAAWGKSRLSLNWCDPELPVSIPTATRRWSQELFRKLAGRDVGPLAQERIPEVLVEVVRNGVPVADARVFAEAGEGQGLRPYGVVADRGGTAWFVLPEPGLYRFNCESESVEVEVRGAPVEAPAGYQHLRRVRLELQEEGP